MDFKEIIENFLKKSNFKYTYIEDDSAFRLGFNMSCKLKQCEVFIRLDKDFLLIHGQIEIKADKHSIDKISEYLTRANYGLIFGNFELDYTDGEIRYKLAVDCMEGSTLTDNLLRKSIFLPVMMFDKYGNGLLEVLFDFATPEEAINKIER